MIKKIYLLSHVTCGGYDMHGTQPFPRAEGTAQLAPSENPVLVIREQAIQAKAIAEIVIALLVVIGFFVWQHPPKKYFDARKANPPATQKHK